jgi:hypothetical protein
MSSSLIPSKPTYQWATDAAVARPPDSTVLNSHETPRYVPHRGRVVPVPPAVVPGQNSYSDRMARCAQAGAAAGVGANHLGAFTTQCAN